MATPSITTSTGRFKFTNRDKMRRKKFKKVMLSDGKLQKLIDSSSPVPAPPPTTDYTKGNTLQFPVDGNNQYGDCYYACIAHGSNTFTGNVGTECSFDANQLTQRYLEISGGDNGLDTDQAMTEWTGGIVGPSGPRKIIAEMPIEPTDVTAMQTAIYLFGGVSFTLGIPDAWLANPEPGSVWDGGPGVVADDNNGHAVFLNGYGPDGYTLQTWGFNPPVTITPAGVEACDPEATVQFSLDWFDGTGRAPNGFTYEELATMWVQLGGSPLPPSPFPPNPTPPSPPVPTPPVPPSPPSPPSPPTPVPPSPPSPPTPPPAPATGTFTGTMSRLTGAINGTIEVTQGGVMTGGTFTGTVDRFAGTIDGVFTGGASDGAPDTVNIDLSTIAFKTNTQPEAVANAIGDFCANFGVQPSLYGTELTLKRPTSITPAQWAVIIQAILAILAAFGIA